MIADKETNFVYFSSLLEKKCPKVFGQLKYRFERLEIKFGILPNTRDLWVVDFMPLQIKQDYFLQYTYDPDYLKFAKYESTKTNPKLICEEIGIVPNKVSIVLDGGNIVKCKTKAILTSKVFKDNPDYPEFNLIPEIRNQLQVEQVIIIPQEPEDFVGHSDGMVRFIDENKVLINKYPDNKVYKEFGYNLRWSLKNAGLDYVEFPYDAWKNKNANDATGCYINFLEIGKYIFYPVFAEHNDQWALILLEQVFKDREFFDIDCRKLAKLGGVLNCATWNIKR